MQKLKRLNKFFYDEFIVRPVKCFYQVKKQSIGRKNENGYYQGAHCYFRHAFGHLVGTNQL